MPFTIREINTNRSENLLLKFYRKEKGYIIGYAPKMHWNGRWDIFETRNGPMVVSDDDVENDYILTGDILIFESYKDANNYITSFNDPYATINTSLLDINETMDNIIDKIVNSSIHAEERAKYKSCAIWTVQFGIFDGIINIQVLNPEGL